MDIMHEEASADMQGMVGADPGESVDTPWLESVAKRLPWLVVNMVNSALSASVVYMFEGTIAQMAALAVLMPMVANQAGNTGQQALAVMIRQLATDRFEQKKAWLAVLREAKIGLFTGVIMALLAFVGAWIFTSVPQVGMVMAGALFCDMMLGAVAGAPSPSSSGLWDATPRRLPASSSPPLRTARASFSFWDWRRSSFFLSVFLAKKVVRENEKKTMQDGMGTSQI